MSTGRRLGALVVCVAALAAAGPASARQERPKPDYTRKPGILETVGFDQKPGAQLPLDLKFRDEQGREVALGDLLSGRPVIVNLVYFDCPLLCNQVLDSLVRALNVVPARVGRDFDVLSVSIDPRDTPEKAAAKEADVLGRYTAEGPEARAGWHFLTGDEAAIERLAATVGFRYSYNARLKQYAHPAGVVFATPEGVLSRYIYGLSFPARDLNLALAEASAGKVGGVVAQALLLCYAYDPNSGGYSFAIMSVVRVLGTLTALGLAAFMYLMFRRDRRRRPRATGHSPLPAGTPPPVAAN
jgi:protein SCO1/2